MKPQHHLLIFPIIFSLLFLGGCKDSQTVIHPEEDPDVPQIELPVSRVEEPVKLEPEIVSITIEPTNLILSPGTKYQLSVVVRFSDQKSEELLATFSDLNFYSSHPKIATINQEGIIDVAENAPIGSSILIEAFYDGISSEASLLITYSLEDTIMVIEDGIDQVTNVDSYAVVVNKVRSLPDPARYVPQDLVKANVPFSFTGENERSYLRESAAHALEGLFKQAKEDGIQIVAVSGYRSYATQRAIFNNNLITKGEEHTLRYSAFPGTSEHQTGLAMDVSSPSINNRLDDSLSHTVEGKWLAENAPHFGFIIRYPYGKEEITGYAYEPWHLRFVGIDLAMLLAEQETTMEEFFAESIPVSGNVDVDGNVQ